MYIMQISLLYQVWLCRLVTKFEIDPLAQNTYNTHSTHRTPMDIKNNYSWCLSKLYVYNLYMQDLNMRSSWTPTVQEAHCVVFYSFVQKISFFATTSHIMIRWKWYTYVIPYPVNILYLKIYSRYSWNTENQIWNKLS